MKRPLFNLRLLAFGFFLAWPGLTRAEDHSALRAVATTEYTEVHPESVFEVTLAVENVSDTVQTIKIPDCGWDRLWKSSNRHITWDYWDCDYNEEITVDIAPHKSYTFPKPLKMYVDAADKEVRMAFRMGFKARTFGQVLWSSPISVDVIP